ncbi:hypothetical protein [Halobacillus seohaensis]|uniref:Uncharacterized protein n=1 Tax=Halobacillus seohaensis TaxID=447421 RepID=A0ABW2EKM2_9BACI
MIIRSYIFPLIIFVMNTILLSTLMLEIIGVISANRGGLGFFVPLLSLLSFQFIRFEQRKRKKVSRGLSVLQAINAFTFVFPFVVLAIFLLSSL